jgi:hypothetical protein
MGFVAMSLEAWKANLFPLSCQWITIVEVGDDKACADEINRTTKLNPINKK